MYVLLTPIKSSCPFRLCGPRHFRPADSSVVFSSDYSAINEKDEDKMTDSNSSNKAAPPKFSGQADDYIDWRRQFAAHMRDEKGININKRAAGGTLALSDAKKVALADRLTRALGKHSILYESEQDDGVAMLAALEARFEHFSASEQRRITQRLMTLELTDPGACDDFIVEMKTYSPSYVTLGRTSTKLNRLPTCSVHYPMTTCHWWRVWRQRLEPSSPMS